MVYQWQVKLAYYSGSRISSTIFRPTAYKGRKRISISCARTHTHAHTHAHTHTHTHAHTHTQTRTRTHTDTNNGFIMMVTLVMTYTNYFFDLNFNMCCHGNAPYKCAHSPLSQKLTTNLQSSSSNQSVENSLPHALSKQTSTCDP